MNTQRTMFLAAMSLAVIIMTIMLLVFLDKRDRKFFFSISATIIFINIILYVI
ncbi:MAG: hypothetical protein ACRCUS_07705 [Anaerovoracaceae bacterium]